MPEFMCLSVEGQRALHVNFNDLLLLALWSSALTHFLQWHSHNLFKVNYFCRVEFVKRKFVKVTLS